MSKAGIKANKIHAKKLKANAAKDHLIRNFKVRFYKMWAHL